MPVPSTPHLTGRRKQAIQIFTKLQPNRRCVVPMIILIIVAIFALIIGFWLMGTVLSVVWHLLVGLLIGAVARWVLPGQQSIGLFATALCGAIGSVLGGAVAQKLLGQGGGMSFVFSVACAAGVISLWGRL